LHYICYYKNIILQSSFEQLTNAFQTSWTGDSSLTPEEWDLYNPARGQYISSALVVQDFLGGDLIRYKVIDGSQEESHYCNRINDGTIIDTTVSQYPIPVVFTDFPININNFSSIREKLMDETSIRKRYEILRARVAKALDSLDVFCQ